MTRWLCTAMQAMDISFGQVEKPIERDASILLLTELVTRWRTYWRTSTLNPANQPLLSRLENRWPERVRGFESHPRRPATRGRGNSGSLGASGDRPRRARRHLMQVARIQAKRRKPGA